MTTNPVRFGILGAGRIAEGATLPAMTNSDACAPVAIADYDHARARAVADKFNIPKVYKSNDEVIADPEVEVVYVALPNHLHVEWAAKAAHAGKHVLVEKPIALKRKDLDAFDGVDPKLRVAEAFMVRHQPRWQALREIIGSRKHGAPRTVSSLLSFMMTKTDDFRTRPEFGGGAVYDLGSYTAMAARFIFGREPKRVFAESELDGRKIDMFSSVILDFGGGDHAIFAVSLAQASAQTLQIVCEGAFIELPKAYVPSRTEPNLIHVDLSQDHAKSDLTTLSFDALDQYQAEMTNFARAVRGEKVPFYGLDDARANMAVMDAIFASAASSDWVKVEK